MAQKLAGQKIVEICKLGDSLSEPLRGDFRAFSFWPRGKSKKIEKTKIDKLKSRKKQNGRTRRPSAKGKNINHKTIGEIIKDFI